MPKVVSQQAATSTLDNFVDSRFCSSHVLQKHPVRKEPLLWKIRYLNALYYFIEKYAGNDLFTQKMLKNYQDVILPQGTVFQRIEAEKETRNLIYILDKHFWRIKHTLWYVFICDLAVLIAPNDEAKFLNIMGEVLLYVGKRYHSDIDALCKLLYRDEATKTKFELTGYHIQCWRLNKLFSNNMAEKTIMVSSNMSSGKSTLINALVGKKINRSMNEACTSKLHYIYDKPFEDGFIYKFDYDLDLNADSATLMENNENNKKNTISVASYFRFTGNKCVRLCVIDSPGVNNSLDATQQKIKKSVVSQDFDVFVYVINAEYIGTTDDFVYLEHVKNNLKGKNILFVINKLDKFRLLEDDIEDSINKIREQLEVMGFAKPTVCPISAYTGYMAKQKLFDNDLSESQKRQYEVLAEKFDRDEYDLSKYYDHGISSMAKSYIEKADENSKKELTLLYNSGLLCLETLLYRGEK